VVNPILNKASEFGKTRFGGMAVGFGLMMLGHGNVDFGKRRDAIRVEMLRRGLEDPDK
jgi:hypothetical protein